MKNKITDENIDKETNDKLIAIIIISVIVGIIIGIITYPLYTDKDYYNKLNDFSNKLCKNMSYDTGTWKIYEDKINIICENYEYRIVDSIVFGEN
jgi:hypothetical protein